MIDPALRKKIRDMLAEDLGPGDVTSETLFGLGLRARATVTAKQKGTLAGVAEAVLVFGEVGVKVKVLRRDGASVSPGDRIMILEGPARKILAAERVALNLMMRMSGIATATRQLIALAKRKNPRVVVAATRKTAPLLKYFDKRAVVAAGGSPHRFNLSDQVLIKDNHLKLAGSITEAVNKFKAGRRLCDVEVEVTTPEEALEAARAGADIVMLDNMAPSQIARAIVMLKNEGLRGRVSLEASGGIDPSNIARFAATGVDVISTSYMTMRSHALDLSLKITGAIPK